MNEPVKTDRGIILVTGGSGHLGANLVRRLLSSGEAVRVLVRKGSDNRALDGLRVELVYGDLRDPEAVAAAVRGVWRVYHCAARLSTVAGGEQEIFDCNVMGTRNLLEAAQRAGVARVVVSGSLGAVGHLEGRESDETVPFYPFGHAMPYEHTKALVEHECLRMVAEGLDVVIAVSCAIMGPNDYKPSRMGKTLLDFANGELGAYIPGGFAFVSTADIVEGHLLCMERGRRGQKYIFATEFVTVDQLMELFEATTGTRKPRLRLPGEVMAGIAAVTSPILTRFFPHVPQRLTPAAVRLLSLGRRASSKKAQDELGFRPGKLGHAVKDAYADFVRRGLVKNRHAGEVS